MLTRLAFAVVLLAAFAALTLRDAPPAEATFHCMRIHAVMAGVNGNASIQYVELRTTANFQTSVSGTQLRFLDAAGTQTGTFTLGFLAPITNTAAGSSILIGSDDPGTPLENEFQDAFGITPNFTMDPNVLAPAGRVEFLGNFNCPGSGISSSNIIDSVAYGAYTGDNGNVPEVGAQCGADTVDDDGDGMVNDGCIAVSVAEPLFQCRDSLDNDGDGSVNDGCPVSPNFGAAASLTPLPTTGTQALTLVDGNIITIEGNSASYQLQTAAPRNNANQVGVIIDTDGDGISDTSDLCPGTAPAAPVDGVGCSDAQVDSDGDTVCDPGAPSVGPSGCTGSDNCPAWPNPLQTLPPWTVVLDGSDPDCDGHNSADETFIGTDPNVACGVGAWAVDINDSQGVDIFDVLELAPPAFFSVAPGPPYSVRIDLQPSGGIDIFDVLRMAPPMFFSTCTP